MATLAARHDPLMPRPPDGLGRGLVLALLVHGLLVAGLAVSVNWRSSSVAPPQAELWAAVPQVAAPRAAAPEPRPAPPPEPAAEAPRPRPAEPPPRPAPVEKARPDPQIAIEQARKEKERERQLEEQREREQQKKEAARKLELAKAKAEQAEKVEKAEKAEAALAERKRLDQERREKAQAAEKDKAEATRLAEARAAAVKRMLEQAGSGSGEPGSSGTAAQNAAPSAGYTGRVVARVKPNIVFVDNLATNPEAEVLLRLAPDGRIISQKLVRSSGIKEWDQAVQRAIERTEILPRDTDGRVPASMVISFRPRE
jgi:colicin import membrane protein